MDEKKVDEVIRGAYREIVKARQPLMEAAVAAMLDPNVEVFEVELTDSSKVVVTGQEAQRCAKRAGYSARASRSGRAEDWPASVSTSCAVKVGWRAWPTVAINWPSS